MKKNVFRKLIAFLLSVTTLLSLTAIPSLAAGETQKYGSNKDTAATLEEMQQLIGVSSYAEYLAANGNDYKSGLPTIKIDIFDTVAGSNGVKPSESNDCLESFKEDKTNWENFGDAWDSSLYLPSAGKTTWNFQIPDGADSYYYIKIEYFSCLTGDSSISSIERKLYIDGRPPFNEASYVKFDKNWAFMNYTVTESTTDEPDGIVTRYELVEKGEASEKGYFKIVEEIRGGKKTVTKYRISQDINGNSMLPPCEQTPNWNTQYVEDTSGYYNGYFRFYLLNGSHQITLAAEREPIIIKSIELIPYGEGDNTLPKYEDIKNLYAEKGYTAAEGGNTIIQAEFPDFVSDSSVYPTNDATSNATYPSISKAQLYNVIGENSYNAIGQWAAYKFKVGKTGLYKLGARFKQSALQGMYICRTLLLSGGMYGLADGTPTVPFEEAYDAQFNYSEDWQSSFIGDSNGNVFEFYFEEGVEYTIYVKCSLGSLKELIQRVENSMNAVNAAYLRILQRTGSVPDEFTDYKFDEIMPDVLRTLGLQAKELDSVKKELAALCNIENAAHLSTLETVAILLDKMCRNEGDNIAANMGNLKTYLGTLGTWVNDSKKGTLVLDSLAFVPSSVSDKELSKNIIPASSGFFSSLWYEITSFIYSFFTDYDAMGLTKEPDENTSSVSVWLATGRDQSQIWRTMIDAEGGFTDITGNAVTLKLVTASTLLPSILAGKGPDVYIGLGSADVINYAIRDAILGINGTDARLSQEENDVFKQTYYTYKDENGNFEHTTEYRGEEGLTFVSDPFDVSTEKNYTKAAIDTLVLGDTAYGIPETMSFAMMFYRMDVLAELGQTVPETWGDLLSILPALQTNNLAIGVTYISALDFMLYQKGGNMWKYTDDPYYAGAEIALDSNIALESFEFVCRLYTDYSFDVSFNASNRFRTGEMPIIVSDYISMYNTLKVFATEIEGLWEFCPLPGSRLEDGSINYNSLASVTASVVLNGCDDMLATWQFMQWQCSAEIQANYGNKMVALIGPSAKYNTANINAIKDLSWTAEEWEAIEDQIQNMSSIVNYPGSYIISRYMNFAFLDAVGGAEPVDALSEYIDIINDEITRKREEFSDRLGVGKPPYVVE
jgi:ABC-type glycerol-3-phosphate transport system substrate-binding protein